MEWKMLRCAAESTWTATRRHSRSDRDGCTAEATEHAEKSTASAAAEADRVCRKEECAERLGTSTLPRQSAKQAWAIKLRIRRLVLGARLRKTQVSTRPMRRSADCVQSARGSRGCKQRCAMCVHAEGCRPAENRSAHCIAWAGGMARAGGSCHNADSDQPREADLSAVVRGRRWFVQGR